MKTIKRSKEINMLKKMLSEAEAQLYGIYGRRRVGKTYLVRTFFAEKKSEYVFLEFTGKKTANLQEQLKLFTESLLRGLKENGITLPIVISSCQTWKEAFTQLSEVITQLDKSFVIFLDEAPWMASRRSGFLKEFEYIWNSQWSKINGLKVIICGSSSSWILNKIIHNKQGLHNRITGIINLKPFNLRESKQYLEGREVNLSEREILELHLCVGGVPYYLSWIDNKDSLPQIIQKLFFEESGLLYKEYETLLSSLFEKPNYHEILLRTLSKKRVGLNRTQIRDLSKVSEGSRLSDTLAQLEASNFIKRYIPFSGSSRQHYYRLIDPYIFFYLKWLEPLKRKGSMIQPEHWLKQFNTQSYRSWSGYSFETLCFCQNASLLKALNISGMSVNLSTWQYKQNNPGAQVDLVLDRADGIINLCEIKFRREPLIIDKEFLEKLSMKEAIFRNTTKTKRSTQSIIITASNSTSTVKHNIPIVDSQCFFRE